MLTDKDDLIFSSQCVLALKAAYKLAGQSIPDEAFLADTTEDMTRGLPFSLRKYCIAVKPSEYETVYPRIAGLFRLARMNYARVPDIRALKQAWDNHVKPQDAPAPKDAPRLAPPAELVHSEAQMRHLAAVRTSIACGGHMRMMTMVRDATEAQMRELEAQEWMLPLLELDPSRGEVEAMRRATTENGLAFYRRRPDLHPCWGKWLAHYGI